MNAEVTEGMVRARARELRIADEAERLANPDAEYLEQARAEVESQMAQGNQLLGPSFIAARKRAVARGDDDVMRREARAIAVASGEKYEIVLQRLMGTVAAGKSIIEASKMVAAAGRR